MASKNKKPHRGTAHPAGSVWYLNGYQTKVVAVEDGGPERTPCLVAEASVLSKFVPGEIVDFCNRNLYPRRRRGHSF